MIEQRLRRLRKIANWKSALHGGVASKARQLPLLTVLSVSLLALSGCVTENASLQQERLELVRDQIELTKLHIELAKAALARLQSQTQQDQALAQARRAGAADLQARRTATVVLLRNIAREQRGTTGKTYSSLADWVEAGGDPDRALQAALPNGIPK
jgi:hypothetical protein